MRRNSRLSRELSGSCGTWLRLTSSTLKGLCHEMNNFLEGLKI
jgi:hypothetical protein